MAVQLCPRVTTTARVCFRAAASMIFHQHPVVDIDSTTAYIAGIFVVFGVLFDKSLGLMESVSACPTQNHMCKRQVIYLSEIIHYLFRCLALVWLVILNARCLTG